MNSLWLVPANIDHHNDNAPSRAHQWALRRASLLAAAAKRRQQPNKPGLDRVDGLAHTDIFRHSNWSIDTLVPHRRSVGTIHNGHLDQYFRGQWRRPAVTGHHDYLEVPALRVTAIHRLVGGRLHTTHADKRSGKQKLTQPRHNGANESKWAVFLISENHFLIVAVKPMVFKIVHMSCVVFS